MNLLIDLQYFPQYNLFKISNKFSNIVFDQYEYYQKMSFRNRCQIAGAEGMINLSVPLEKGRDQKSVMKDVRISDRMSWQDQHWKTIVSCYSRSPWFEYYRDGLEGLYKKSFLFLVDWNLHCFDWAVRALQMPVSFSLTNEYRKNYGDDDWLDWRGKILPKDRVWPPVIPVLGNEIMSNGEANQTVKYRQVFEERTGFLPNLSILDLLFCEGKRAGDLLR
jgi:WbqC-like protein